MPRVTWMLPDGGSIEADVPIGQSLMDAAVTHNVPKVIGECGGCLSCATCHVHVAPEWLARTGTMDESEDSMLEVVEGERRPQSRLSCQILMTEALDGLVLRVPAN